MRGLSVHVVCTDERREGKVTEFLLGAAAFLGMALWDFLCAIYVLAVSKRQAVRAGLVAAAMFLVSALVLISVVQDNWLVLPASVGAFAGTFLAIKVVK